MTPQEFVIPLKPLEGIRCPQCNGFGHLNDGYCSISDTEARFRPGTPCSACKGRGRLKEIVLVPFDD
jgi:DnaJ-class molecular chaperone